MKIAIRELVWRVFGYPEAPPRKFGYKLTRINKYNHKVYTPRYAEMTRYYLMGITPEEIAAIFNVTRERVRQCLWKCYRNSQ